MTVKKSPEKDKFINIAAKLFQKINNNPALLINLTEKRNQTDFKTILGLTQFFKLCDDGLFKEALVLIENLDLLPLSLDKKSDAVKQKVQDFGSLSEEIKRNFPEILRQTITVLSICYENTTRTVSKPEILNYELQNLRDKAEQLTKFSNKILTSNQSDVLHDFFLVSSKMDI